MPPKQKNRAVVQFVIFVIVAAGLSVIVASPKMEDPLVEAPRYSANFQNIEDKLEANFEYSLVHSNSNLSYPGFTILPVSGTAETVLVNHSGKVVHRWAQDAERARLLPNCNLLTLHGSKWGYRQPKWRNLKFAVYEYDWQDRKVWQYDTDEWAHHDVLQRENGNIIFLKRTTVPSVSVEAVADVLGNTVGVRSDSILEVTRDKQVVWKWNVHDHFNFNYCGWRGCDYLRVRGLDTSVSKFKDDERVKDLEIESIADWSHANTVTELPDNKWYRAGDKRFTPGNLMLIVRNFWTAYIIDKTSGKVVWEYDGNPINGDESTGMVRGHDGYMIADDLPGAGNILFFDNGLKDVRPYSRIIEIDPVTQKIAWEYKDIDNFFSDAAGSMQRLPNGNTLISEDKSGRVFEVTRSGEVVWDMRGPHRISRAERYSYNHCPELQRLQLR